MQKTTFHRSQNHHFFYLVNELNNRFAQMKTYSFIFFMCSILVGCNTTDNHQTDTNQTNEPEKATGVTEFWEQLASYCGQTFEGQITSTPAPDEFSGKQLVMHILSCENDFIIIPFNVGENRSRTWLLHKKDNRIELKHDHRKEDGSDDEITLYGGQTTNSGLSDIQVFPADEATKKLIPAAATNVWWMTINENSFTYNLKRIGSDRVFSVDFDLSTPIETPKPSWGWEGE